MKKKNILFIIPSLDIGGAETLVIKKINELNKVYNVFLVVLSNELYLKPNLDIEEKRIYILNSKFKTLSLKSSDLTELISVSKKIKNIIYKNQVNTVLANLPISHFILRVIKLISIVSKVKVVNIHHSMQFSANPIKSIKNRIFLTIDNILSVLYDNRNVFVSKAVEKDICKHFFIPKNKREVIYNSITTYDKFTEFNPYSKLENIYNILIVGRLVPEKGYKEFLSMLKDILEKNVLNKNIYITIVGDGPLRNEIQNYLDANKMDNIVKLLGSKENTEVYQYYKYSNLVVIPSKVEGFGLIALEAILSGATVLSSTAGGLGEIVTDQVNGYAYSNNIEFYDKFVDIVNDNLNLYLKENGIEFTKNKFSFDNMISQYQNIIEMKV